MNIMTIMKKNLEGAQHCFSFSSNTPEFTVDFTIEMVQ